MATVATVMALLGALDYRGLGRRRGAIKSDFAVRRRRHSAPPRLALPMCVRIEGRPAGLWWPGKKYRKR